MHNFKKQFGQNFLKNKSAAKKLVDSLDLTKEDVVIEIGPGHGAVTELILPKVKKLIAIEIDEELIGHLKYKFKKYESFELINKDVLKIENEELGMKKKEYKVIGSLPYNISKPIIKKFLTEEPKPSTMSFIIQKEVAEDYAADAPRATFLSNFAKVYSEAEYIETVKASDFHPMPKVDGGIVKFRINNERMVKDGELVKFIKIGFSSPRKILMNNLSNLPDLSKEELATIFTDLKINPKARAAELPFETWVTLFNKLTAGRS